jgi:hypothetical protein
MRSLIKVRIDATFRMLKRALDSETPCARRVPDIVQRTSNARLDMGFGANAEPSHSIMAAASTRGRNLRLQNALPGKTLKNYTVMAPLTMGDWEFWLAEGWP